MLRQPSFLHPVVILSACMLAGPGLISAELESPQSRLTGPAMDAARSERTFDQSLRFIYPLATDKGADSALPVKWSPVGGALRYTLKIGREPGSADLYLAENIAHVNGLSAIRHFVPELPAGTQLHVTVLAHLQDTTMEAGTSFRITGRSDPFDARRTTALAVMQDVHNMAQGDKRMPVPGTYLDDFTAQNKRARPVCTDYASVLNAILLGMKLGHSRILNVAFSERRYDAHSLVAFRPSIHEEEMILDPTFNLSAKRASDGAWASGEDISRSTRRKTWHDIDYVGDREPAERYYLDYPLLFLNPFDSTAPAASPMPYLTRQPDAVRGPRNLYAVRCEGRAEIQIMVDNVEVVKALTGPESLSPIFFARSIQLPAGNPEGVEIYLVNRYVFVRK